MNKELWIGAGLTFVVVLGALVINEAFIAPEIRKAKAKV